MAPKIGQTSLYNLRFRVHVIVSNIIKFVTYSDLISSCFNIISKCLLNSRFFSSVLNSSCLIPSIHVAYVSELLFVLHEIFSQTLLKIHSFYSDPVKQNVQKVKYCEETGAIER